MTKLLSTALPGLGHIVLDSNTARFFDPAYSSAPAQRLFRLPLRSQNIKKRVFAGRLAPLQTGLWAIVAQEYTFDAFNPMALSPSPLVIELALDMAFQGPISQQHVDKVWDCVLSNGRQGRLVGKRNTPRPTVNAKTTHLDFHVWRPYFDSESGLGWGVGERGVCHLMDLRGETMAINGEGETVRWNATIEPKWAHLTRERDTERVLVTMADFEFRQAMNAVVCARGFALNQTQRFFQLSEDSRCWETWRFNGITRQKILEVCGKLLQIEMHGGGALAGINMVRWFPLASGGAQLHIPSPNPFYSGWNRISLPAAVEERAMPLLAAFPLQQPHSGSGSQDAHRTYKIRRA